jgi:hypothetical protein
MRGCCFAGVIADAETLHPHKHRVPWRDVTLICGYAELTTLMRRFFALRNRSFFTHDLARKPVPIPDQVEDMLFGIMRRA